MIDSSSESGVAASGVMRLGRWLVVSGVALACGGIIDRQVDEQTGGSGSGGGGGRTAAPAPRGGTSSVVGSKPSTGGRATMPDPAVGGRPFGWPLEVTGGAPVDVGAGGGDVGGSGDSATGGSAGECHFEYLGDWIRCEGNDTWPWLMEVPNDSVDDCLRACLVEPTCVGVVDHYHLNLSYLGCVLDVSVCDHPATNSWAEEDGGKEYLKVCD